MIEIEGKSATVILTETKMQSIGITADLLLIRVAPRIGLKKKDSIKVEKELMQVLRKEI